MISVPIKASPPQNRHNEKRRDYLREVQHRRDPRLNSYEFGWLGWRQDSIGCGTEVGP